VTERRALEREVVVTNELGLHARPAASFAALSGQFASEISVSRKSDDKWVNGKSVLSLLSLAASRGTALRIRAEGTDAESALEALVRLIEHPEQASG
jgi:phosphocarrier protein HPr